MRVLTILGTRPEAIKLAPVIRALDAAPAIDHTLCVTGQHREMLDQVLDLFGITPDHDLDLMTAGQDLNRLAAAVLSGVGNIIGHCRPDWVVVQGDTTTAVAAAITAFHHNVKVAHVEAGLRTGDLRSPWPEEMNRRLISQIASLHFAPTPQAAANLKAEGIAEDAIVMTGNTVVDALHHITAELDRAPDRQAALDEEFAFLDRARRLVLVTGHRRENLDAGLGRMCQALRRVADRGDVDILYPVHLNPAVRSVAHAALADHPSIHLIEPVDYLAFVYLMRRCHLIVTDSGGVQEEAPALGKPVLIARDTTERPEAIAAGAARLVGAKAGPLAAAIHELLDDHAAYQRMAQARDLFGDGKAASRIAERLAHVTPR